MTCDICGKNKPTEKDLKNPYYVMSICKDCLLEEELESFAMKCFRLGFKAYNMEVK